MTALRSSTMTPRLSRIWTKILITTVVVAIPAFLLSPNAPLGGFWRPSATFPTPPASLLPFFLLLNLTEVLTFGLGIGFLIFGYPLVEGIGSASRGLTRAAHLSITWLLVNWWPHDSLHLAVGTDMSGILGIEYGFHVTMMIAGAILAWFFLRLMRPMNAAR